MNNILKVVLIILAIMPIIVFLMVNILNNKRMKKSLEIRKKEIESLKINQKVLTMAGFYGTIKEIRNEIIDLEISKDVIIEINRASIVQSI